MNDSAPFVPLDPDAWIERLRQIPDTHRTFDVGIGRAKSEFGLDDLLIQGLIDRGLPHAAHDGEWRLANVDLHYLGVRLGTATVYLTAMRSWADALVSSARHPSTLARVRYVPYAAVGSDVEVLTPLRGRMRVTTERDRTATRVEVRMRCNWPRFDPAIYDILTYVGSLDFCLLPEALETDSAFVRRTGLASCASAAQLIVEECARLGIEARGSFGLLLAAPLATPRNWAEIRIAGSWVPADPLLLATLSRYAALDEAAWPPISCPGAVLLRLADERRPIVTRGEEPVASSFVTSLSPEPTG